MRALKGRERVTALLSAVVFAVVALVATAAPPAFAGPSHPSLGSITEANGKPLEQPRGLAFDGSGNLFAADAAEISEEPVVDIFNSSNAFTAQFGKGLFSEHYLFSVAVNNTTGVVYVGDSGSNEHEKVSVFKPEGGGKYKELKGLSLKGLGFVYVAVDNSTGPHSGDVYVVAALGKQSQHLTVYKTNVEGELESPEELKAPPSTGFELINFTDGNGGITVDPSTGKLYVSEDSNSAVSVYSSTGVFEKQFAGTETPATFFRPNSVAVDPSSGDVYVSDEANKVVDEFDSSGKYLKSQMTFSATPLAVGVQPSNGHVYVSDGAKIDIFGGGRAYAVTVKKSGTGTGTVESSPAGINCGTECSTKVEEGKEITLTATPAAGSSFAGWSGCTKVTAGKCEVTVSAAAEVTAEFSLNPPVNTVLPAISGTAQASHTLKTTNGSWEGGPSGFAYQWEDCNALGEGCLAIGGATSNEYTLTNLDVGDTVRVIVTATNGGGSTPATSAQTAVVEAGASNQINPVVEGTVPKTESLESTCTKVPLGEFLPGVTASYEGTCALKATDTSGESKVTAEDAETSNHEGHLVQGSYFLPKPLEVKATDAQEVGAGGPFTALTSPVTLLTYGSPISAHELTVTFNQSIAKNDGLHTGRYAKTITITLSTTKA